jgi:hypothetical protein
VTRRISPYTLYCRAAGGVGVQERWRKLDVKQRQEFLQAYHERNLIDTAQDSPISCIASPADSPLSHASTPRSSNSIQTWNKDSPHSSVSFVSQQEELHTPHYSSSEEEQQVAPQAASPVCAEGSDSD